LAGVEVVSSEHAAPALLDSFRALLVDAFGGDFSDDDWAHCLGGLHVYIEDPDIVAHAAVVRRPLDIGSTTMQAGYVEGVATEPARQRQGLGSLVMRRVNDLIAPRYQLGALSTGEHAFYEQLGWQRWRGETFVQRAGQLVRTPDDDDAVMVLLFGPSRDVDPTSPIACTERPGDDW
jgi:aminoglycoside 2'-N-acetyltransferase I